MKIMFGKEKNDLGPKTGSYIPFSEICFQEPGERREGPIGEEEPGGRTRLKKGDALL